MENYTIDVPQPVLDDLRDRLANTRWPTPVARSGWERGTDIDYLQRLCEYWRDGFDWRTQEAELNRLNHERHIIDGSASTPSISAATDEMPFLSSSCMAGPTRSGASSRCCRSSPTSTSSCRRCPGTGSPGNRPILHSAPAGWRTSRRS